MKEKSQKRRGEAASDTQLSELQVKILQWVQKAGFSGHIKKSIDQDTKKIGHKKVAWSAKKFYNDAPSPSQTASLSKALHRLADRGLVTLYPGTDINGAKPRTTHVSLTKAGEKAASIGMTKRQYAIRYEIAELRQFKNALIEARMLQHEVRPSVSIPPSIREIVGLKKQTLAETWPFQREEYLTEFGSWLWVIFGEIYRTVTKAIRERAEKIGDDLEPDEVTDSEMLTYKYLKTTFPTDPIDSNVTITG